MESITQFDINDEWEDQEFLRDECRSVKTLTDRELLAKAKKVRRWAEAITALVIEPEREFPVTVEDAESLDFFMKILNAIDKEATRRGLSLLRWKAQEATAWVLKELKSWVRKKRSTVITFPAA